MQPKNSSNSCALLVSTLGLLGIVPVSLPSRQANEIHFAAIENGGILERVEAFCDRFSGWLIVSIGFQVDYFGFRDSVRGSNLTAEVLF